MRKAIQTVWEQVNNAEQVIDEVTQDRVRRAEFDPKAKENAAALVRSFRDYCDAHRDQIEALQLLYSVPYRAGLRFVQVKELAEALKTAPARFDWPRVWDAYGVLEPDRVKSRTDRQKVADLIALVRHAIDPNAPLVPMDETVNQRYAAWLAEQQAAGRTFTADQRKWLDAIRDHIATSVRIDRDDLADVPFHQMGGLGKAAAVLGNNWEALLDELNERLAA